MPQKNEQSNTTILAIFRGADPVREMLREFASRKGCILFCFDHLFDALSRMPIMDNPHTTVIISRPETLTAEAVAAFEPLVNPNTTHYVLWLDSGLNAIAGAWPLRPSTLHTARHIAQFEGILNGIRHQPPPVSMPDSSAAFCRHPLKLQNIPLSKAEIDALLGAE